MTNRDHIVTTLRAHERAMRDRGVLGAALFGSFARGEARKNSDIDVYVDLDPKAQISVFDYADIVGYIKNLFPEPVDVSNHDMLKPHVRPSAERDAIQIF